MSEELDLYDSEVQELLQILGKLQIKYGTRRATFENLNAMQNEAMDLCEKAGFIVTISIFDDNMHPKMPPEITVHGRTDPHDFDPDRQQWEVKKEVGQEDSIKKLVSQGGTKAQKVDINATIDAPEKQEE